MASWQEGLFGNLLVVFILASLFIIIYSKLKNKTLLEIFEEFRGMVRVARNE